MNELLLQSHYLKTITRLIVDELPLETTVIVGEGLIIGAVLFYVKSNITGCLYRRTLIGKIKSYDNVVIIASDNNIDNIKYLVLHIGCQILKVISIDEIIRRQG